MAEYKTYTCDICGEQEAIHFCFPWVDQQPDPADGKLDELPGYVDLCKKHAPLLVTKFIKELGLRMAEQRKVWKALVTR